MVVHVYLDELLQIQVFVSNFDKFLKNFKNTQLGHALLQIKIDHLEDTIELLPDIFDQLQKQSLFSDAHRLSKTSLAEKCTNVLGKAKWLTLLIPDDEESFLHERRSSKADIESRSTLNDSKTLDTSANLPRLKTRTFDGNAEEWQSFSSWFTAVIHNHENMSDSLKLCYLQDALTGEPSRLIKEFLVTNENYQKAWNLIRRTYGDEIVEQAPKQLTDVPKLSRDDLKQTLMELLDINEDDKIESTSDLALVTSSADTKKKVFNSSFSFKFIDFICLLIGIGVVFVMMAVEEKEPESQDPLSAMVQNSIMSQ